jgi:hypothetical protein
MKFATVETIARCAREGVDIVFDMQLGKITNTLVYLYEKPNAQAISTAIDCAKEHAGVIFAEDQMLDFLNVFPTVKAGVIESGKFGLDTDATHRLLNGISSFFVGCDWPTYSDAVNDKQISSVVIAKIHSQAIRHGYKIDKDYE